MAGGETKAVIVEKLLLMECRGEMTTTILNGTYAEREMVAVFLESRRLGAVPPYDKKWCVRKGVYPTNVLPGKSIEERKS